MDPRRRKKLDEIMASLDCPANFACYKSGFQNFHTANKINLQELLKCMPGSCCQADRKNCRMLVSSERRDLCRCPMRVYVANYLTNLAALLPPGEFPDIPNKLIRNGEEYSPESS